MKYNEDKVRSIVEQVAKMKKDGDLEVIFEGSESSLTRYANNIIHQNVLQANSEVSVRAQIGKKTGRASVNTLTEESYKWAVDMAYSVTNSQPDNEDLLPMVEPQKYNELDHYDPNTADFSPEQRADIIQRAVEKCRKHGLTAAGILKNDGSFLSLSNSKGLFGYYRGSSATFSITVESDDSSGWAEVTDKDISKIDFDKAIDKAIQIALDSRSPRSIEPGEYDVILEPAAVAEFLLFLSYESFSAQNIIEGTSFLKGKFGEKVFNEKITIHDDVYHPNGLGFPFDFEGIPRQKVVIIDNGIARNVVHNRITAKKMNTQSTGHELPQPNPWGPIPLNLIMMPGESSLNDMIESTNKGILVTHFHYTNTIDPMKMSMTGMTRDGTFMVENGKVSYPIKNMRFTESIIKALSNVELVGKDLEMTEAFFGGSFIVPALKIKSFRFSSGTEF
ncbi:TldD/PmbA family protein [bacterium]|nr:TldD/PmbA family protein [bacterium]